MFIVKKDLSVIPKNEVAVTKCNYQFGNKSNSREFDAITDSESVGGERVCFLCYYLWCIFYALFSLSVVVKYYSMFCSIERLTYFITKCSLRILCYLLFPSNSGITFNNNFTAVMSGNGGNS